jgi:translation initiation factor IF-2
MSIRLNKALRELNIGLQTAVEFLEKRKDLGEVKAEPSFKLSDQQYKALNDAFSQDKEVRDQAEKLITKKAKDKKRAPEQKDHRAESLLESSNQQQYKPLGKIDLNSIGKGKSAESAAKKSEAPKHETAAVSHAPVKDAHRNEPKHDQRSNHGSHQKQEMKQDIIRH